MLNGHTLTSSLQISKEFPKEELASIMRPYLLTYLRILHSTTCDDAWYHLSDELNILLTNFYIFNPKFGRKYMNTKNRTVTFNKDHINYRPVKNPTLMIVF